jgi:RNA polymerase sigma-70 factor (ECF subfamily)
MARSTAVIGESDLTDQMRAIAQRRDRAAFAALFDLYAPKLKAFFRRGGLEGAIAEELVQEVMLTVWQRAASFDPARGSLATWIFAVARNRRTDHLRREQRRVTEPAGPIAPEPLAAAADVLAEQAEWHISLHAAVRALPGDQAELLQLAFFEHKSHSAIAAERNLPLGTVKSRIRLALQRLRQAMPGAR